MKRETVVVLVALLLLSLLLLLGLFVALSTLAAPAAEPWKSSNAAPPLQITGTQTLTVTLPLTSANGTEAPGTQITTTTITSVTDTTAGLGESATETETLTVTTTSTPTMAITATVAPTETQVVPPPEASPAAPTPEQVEATETPTPAPEGIVGWINEHLTLVIGLAVGTFGLVVTGVVLAMFLSKRKQRRKKRTGTRPITPLRPAVAPAAPAPARLVYTDAEGKAQVVILAPEGFTVGRGEDNSLVVGSSLPGWETVSEHHARILRKGADWIVVDLNSHNGVYVNDRRSGRNLLRDGWKLALGGVVFTFRAGKEA